MDLHVHDMGSCCLSLSSPHSWSMKIFDLTSESSLGEEHKGRSASAIFLGENNIISRLHWPLLNDITCISTIFEPEWLWSIPCPRKAFSPPQVAPRTSLNFPHTLLRKSTIIQNTWSPQNKQKHPSHPMFGFSHHLVLVHDHHPPPEPFLLSHKWSLLLKTPSNLKCISCFTDFMPEKKMYLYGRTPFKFHKTNALQFSCICSGSVSLYLSWAW